MRVAVGSDFHNEFSVYKFDNTEADVLVLGGDILLSNRFNTYDPISENTISDRFHTFLNDASEHFKDVIYIMGNHEHYKAKDFATTPNLIRAALKDLSNVHFLDNDCVTLDGIKFVGATLWTDLNKGCPLTTNALQFGMNDFRLIRMNEHGFRRFRATDMINEHEKTMKYFEEALVGVTKAVIVGHHAPSSVSVKPRYQGDHYVNGGCNSDLSEFILDHPQIVLWTHGHTHDAFDYMIGTTQIGRAHV